MCNLFSSDRTCHPKLVWLVTKAVRLPPDMKADITKAVRLPPDMKADITKAVRLPPDMKADIMGGALPAARMLTTNCL